jgi:uncharacterized protein YndB with AHSA1/START domain
MKKVVNTISINADAKKVWRALTQPEETKKYMFGCETVSDWKKGSPLLWKGQYEGKEMVFVSGFILDIKENELLKYNVIDPNASYPKTPENHLNVTYQLKSMGAQTELTVTQDNFENAAEGEKRFKEVDNNGEGWVPILKVIKEQIENS